MGDTGNNRTAGTAGDFDVFTTGRLMMRVNGYEDDPPMISGEPGLPEFSQMTANTKKTGTGDTDLESSDAAQCFTTGSNFYGYPMGPSTTVSLTTTATPREPAFTLHESSPTGTQVTSYGISATIQLQANKTNESYKIVHHPGATLKANTTYCLVAQGGESVSWDYTASNDEVSGGAAGWASRMTSNPSVRGSCSTMRSYQTRNFFLGAGK